MTNPALQTPESRTTEGMRPTSMGPQEAKYKERSLHTDTRNLVNVLCKNVFVVLSSAVYVCFVYHVLSHALHRSLYYRSSLGASQAEGYATLSVLRRYCNLKMWLRTYCASSFRFRRLQSVLWFIAGGHDPYITSLPTEPR